MPKRKPQKVKFHKGDRRPAEGLKYLKYKVVDLKEGNNIYHAVMEEPTNKIVAKYEFEEDAERLASFQNKHQVWVNNGGIPSFLYNYI